MADQFGPDDDQTDLLAAALEGLGCGDLQPLAEFLKSPLPFEGDEGDSYLRHKLVECIEGRALWKLTMERRRHARAKNEEEEQIASFANLALLDFYLARKVAFPRVPAKVIEWEVEEKFGYKRTEMYEQLKKAGWSSGKSKN